MGIVCERRYAGNVSTPAAGSELEASSALRRLSPTGFRVYTQGARVAPVVSCTSLHSASRAARRYGKNFNTSAAVGELEAYLNATYAAYNRSLWLTEFALTDYPADVTQSPTFPNYEQQRAFMAAAVPMLNRLPHVERYAWFSLPMDRARPNETVGLYGSDGAPTPVGSLYRTL
jgi:hypothetical protein